MSMNMNTKNTMIEACEMQEKRTAYSLLEKSQSFVW